MNGQPSVVGDAQFAPNLCAFTDSHKGPFLDLGRDMPFNTKSNQRAYLSLSWVAPALKEAGWVDPEEASALRGFSDLLAAAESRADAAERKLEAILDALREVVPEKVVRQVVQVNVPGEPSDEDILRYVTANRAKLSHLFREEDGDDFATWKAVYGGMLPQMQQPVPALRYVTPEPIEVAEMPSAEVHGSTVNLAYVMEQRTVDVLDFAASDGVTSEVVNQMIELESAGKARKGVLTGLEQILAAEAAE